MRSALSICSAVLLLLAAAFVGAAWGQRAGLGFHYVPEPALESVGGRLAVSPDGRDLYVLGGVDDRAKLTILARDPQSGRLWRPPGPSSCFRPWYIKPRLCGNTPGLNNPRAFAISADGRDVTVTSYPTGQLALLRHNAGTGLSFHSCAGVSVGKFACKPVRGFVGGVDLAFSADGRSLYVAARADDPGLLVFARDAATGVLRQLPGSKGCVQRQGRPQPERPPCAVVPAEWYAPRLVRVTPDGRTVITVSFTEKDGAGIFVFRRDPGSGALTPLTCYVSSGEPACEPIPTATHSLSDIAISRDGRTLVATNGDPVLSVLALDPATGALEQRQCLAPAKAGCARAPAVEYGQLVFAPGGRLFAANDDVIRMYALGGAGTLTPILGRRACLSEYRRSDCTTLPKRMCCAIGSIAVSPDGDWLYAMVGDHATAFRLVSG